MSIVIGIDVSKASLDCAYLRDADQSRAKRKTCQNNVGCFPSLVAWAEAKSELPVQALAFIIEPTHVYHEQLVQFLHNTGATVYLVNPGRVRKFAEGIGILSKNDLIDADLLTRYGLLARNLIAYVPVAQEVNDLRSLLNRLDVLERNLRSELNRQEKVGKTMVFHRLEQQSIARAVKRLKAEIITFKRAVRECIKSTPSLQQNFNLLHTIPGVGAKTAWIMIVILGSRAFRSAPEVASFLGLNPIEKRSGKSQYRRPRLSKSGSGNYRQQLYFPAMVATRKNPDIQALYERLLAADKSKMCALGAAMRKLVHICYGVVKNQTPYQVQTIPS
ncbi:MAG: IS110 family transposase [Gammaproteobacteria bacterium]|nr:IS110 family transposase [Gammaproteobacteria bacterium]